MAGGGAGNWSCRGEGRGGQALGDDGFVFSLPVCAAQTPPPARPLSLSLSLSGDMEELNRDTY